MKEQYCWKVYTWMVDKLHLSGNQLSVFALIYTCTEDSSETFELSLSEISNLTNVPERNVKTIIKSLCKKEYLLKIEPEKGKSQIIIYTINTSKIVK